MKKRLKKPNNYAFIDSQNVNLGIRALGWKVDWRKFRIYLRDKYGVSKAFFFIGYIKDYASLYAFLKQAGFHCIFKPTLELTNGETKGNVDAELVLHTMIQWDNFDKAIVVSGDGDFYCLVEHLIKEKKFYKLLVPDERKYSSLFNRLTASSETLIDSLNSLQAKLSYKMKRATSGTEPFGNPNRRET
ncbi:MAG: hypothetical protein A3C13_03940 [Candidatus Lloydbacteria bacterium RIFCSPHIGHO2_02_FULL_50_11]|nr:MAG: hypothetical protein A3C13_03940 [Candidatus Lloydbacteria bacterium RIFCSPHIGHO2_02_FULL_50_11]